MGTCTITKEQEQLLSQHGWVRTKIGDYKSSGHIKEIDSYILFVRETPYEDFLKKFSLSGATDTPQTLENTDFSHSGSNALMGIPKAGLTPTLDLVVDAKDIFPKPRNSSDLPEIAKFQNFPSLVAARPEKPCILIGYDSEWQTLPRDREMLSWQYTVIWNETLIEFIFLGNCDDNLSLDLAIGCILDHIGVASVDIRQIKRYQYCTGWKNNKPVTVSAADVREAQDKGIYRYNNGDFTHELIDRSITCKKDDCWYHSYLDYSLVESIKVTLVCHTGKVDLTGLSYDNRKNLLIYLTEVQGGLINLQPTRINPRSNKNVNNLSIYPVSLTVSDTLCHAPADNKSLERLGEVVGVPKFDLPAGQKSHMRDLLAKDPVTYMEYAATDSTVTLMYASALYGYNNTPPVTITSAAAKVVKGIMMDYLDCKDTNEFNEKYRGLRKVSHGIAPRRDQAPGYIENSSLEALNDTVNTIQYYGTQSFHGGYNISSEIGVFLKETHDYDLKNAYPTAMCLVPDIDWSNPVKTEVIRQEMTLSNWMMGAAGPNPMTAFVGYVKFEFPESVKYPCIPINVDGVPVYPRTSDGLDGVYAAGPYIYLALMLGAKVWCERGYFLNTLYRDNYSKESRSLAAAIKQLVVDRDAAKKICGKGSLEELILKVMVNAIYGKNAQNVVDKTTWSAFHDCMESLGCSAITNPISATMTTSIVQCLLIAAQNQLHELGYFACSVTTDGFISDCPLEVLESLDLYGFKRFVEMARIYLSDDPKLWERKHAQDDLINFTTRGNVSLHWYAKDAFGAPICDSNGDIIGNPMMINGKSYEGVCAHNSTKSGFISDCYDDRLWLMKQVLSRTGTVDWVNQKWTPTKDLVHGKTFIVTDTTVHTRMDYDLKRKPDRKSFYTDYPVVDGVEYEIAHFDTVPYENVDEFRTYRKKRDLMKVLRTMADWDKFFAKVDADGSGVYITADKDWTVLLSCIIGYRAGRWDIPALSAPGMTVKEKCEWINSHNDSPNKSFKESDWKNCRRPERQVNMLPMSMIQKKLEELIYDYQ